MVGIEMHVHQSASASNVWTESNKRPTCNETSTTNREGRVIVPGALGDVGGDRAVKPVRDLNKFLAFWRSRPDHGYSVTGTRSNDVPG